MKTRIVCLLVGTGDSRFPLKVDKSSTIATVKKTIQKLISLQDLDANCIQLRLAKKNGRWLTDNDRDDIDRLKSGNFPEDLDLHDPLNDDALVSASFIDLGTGCIHVLVHVVRSNESSVAHSPSATVLWCMLLGVKGERFQVVVEDKDDTFEDVAVQIYEAHFAKLGGSSVYHVELYSVPAGFDTSEIELWKEGRMSSLTTPIFDRRVARKRVTEAGPYKTSSSVHIVAITQGVRQRLTELLACETPSTVVHHHPNRLKRWGALNFKLTPNKKVKGSGEDKSLGYSYVTWSDVAGVFAPTTSGVKKYITSLFSESAEAG